MAKVFRIKKLLQSSVLEGDTEKVLGSTWVYQCENKTKEEIRDLGFGVFDEWMEEQSNKMKICVTHCFYSDYWYHRLVGRNCIFDVIGETKQEYIVDIQGCDDAYSPKYYINKEDAEIIRPKEYAPFPVGTPASKLIGKAVEEKWWNNDTFLITGVTKTGVWLDGGEVPFAELFYAYTFLDGSPCGILKENS